MMCKKIFVILTTAVIVTFHQPLMAQDISAQYTNAQYTKPGGV